VFSTSKLFLILDHSKPHDEKIQYIDAELAGHVYKLDVKLQSLGRSDSSCLLCAFLLSLIIDQQHFSKTNMWYNSLPSNLNAVLGYV